MREFAKVSPQEWTSELGRKIKNIGLEARVVSLYLQTNPSAHMTGVYYIPIVLIAHESGLSVEDVKATLNNLCIIDYCSYDYEYEYVWVHGMGINQVSAQLKANDNRVKAINTYYSSLPKLSFLQVFYSKYADLFLLEYCHDFISSLQAPSDFLRSKEKENDNEKKKEKKSFLSGKPDVDIHRRNIFSILPKPALREIHKFKSQAIEVLDFLNEKTGRLYRPVESNLKLIIACLKSGATVDDCRQVIAKKSREWRSDAKMSEYLRPATLFNRVKFEQYIGELVLPKEEQIHVV